MLPNVLFWFYAEVALVYVSEFFGTLLTAYCLWRLLEGRQRFLYASAVALAICGGIKPSAMVFLAPLAVYVLLRAPVKRKVSGVALFIGVTAPWLVPFLVYHGVADYIRYTLEELATAGGQTSALLTLSPLPLLKNARTVLISCAIGAGLFNVIALLVLFLVGARSLMPPRRHCIFAALWMGPSALFFCFFHIGNSGYTLPLVGAFAMYLSYFYDRNLRGRWMILMLAGSVFCSSYHFLGLKKFSPDEIGEGLGFSQKSWSQRLSAQINLFLEPTYASIAGTDHELVATRENVRHLCPDLQNVIVVASDDASVNWRKAQYYFPECLSVRLDDKRSQFHLAKNRSSYVYRNPTLEVKEVCKTFWILGPSHQLVELFRDQTTPQSAGHDLHWTTGPLRIRLPGSKELVIQKQVSWN